MACPSYFCSLFLSPDPNYQENRMRKVSLHVYLMSGYKKASQSWKWIVESKLNRLS